MYKQKIKIFLLMSFVGSALFLLSLNVLAIDDEAQIYSLNFQKILKNLVKKIFPFQIKDEDSIYKEKYYNLLQELAKLKLSLTQIQEEKIFNQKEKYLPNLISVDVLKKDPLGYIYTQFANIKEETIVIDKNWNLIGKVSKIEKNFLKIDTLNLPNLEFNVADLNSNLLGVAKTISNGFLEVNYVKPDVNININDFVLTYGDNYFPSGFLVGFVYKINKTINGYQLIVKLTANFDSEKLFLIKW